MAPSALLRRANPLGDGCHLAPFERARIPRLTLGQIVVARHALGGELGHAFLGLVLDLRRRLYVNGHPGPLFTQPVGYWIIPPGSPARAADTTIPYHFYAGRM